MFLFGFVTFFWLNPKESNKRKTQVLRVKLLPAVVKQYAQNNFTDRAAARLTPYLCSGLFLEAGGQFVHYGIGHRVGHRAFVVL